jgi:hypothetical protein
MLRCLTLVVTLLIASSRTSADEPKPSIPVVIRAVPSKDPAKAGQPIPLTLTIENGLPGPLEFHSYATEPNDWNGETVAIDLVDIYRRGDAGNRFLARPKVKPPVAVTGLTRRVVESGKTLGVRVDASKWQVRDGWQPGSYTVTVRVRVTADGGRCQLAVLSAPVEFTVVKAD